VEDIELSEEVDEGALAEGVGDAGAVGDAGEGLAEALHPLGDHPQRHQVRLVDQQHDVLVREVLPHVLLQRQRPRTHRVTRVQHLHQDVGRVHHLVQLVPDALALAGGHPLVPVLRAVLVLPVLEVVVVQIEVVLLLLDLLDELLHVSEVKLHALPAGAGPEGARVGLDLEQAQLVLPDGLLQQRGRDLLRLHEDLGRVLVLPRHLDPQLL
jgi:hypothetical protein